MCNTAEDHEVVNQPLLVDRDMGRDWKQFVLNITPDRVHPLFRGGYRTAFPDAQKQVMGDSVPVVLPQKRVEGAQLFAERTALLERLPESGRVAELGVAEGNFSREILDTCGPEKLYLVDTWASSRYGKENMEHVRDRFAGEIESKKVQIIRQRSEKALEEFEDNSLDWVYIDTTHSYEQTKLELELARLKVDEGGFIAGHDYTAGNIEKGLHYGVIEAVHEFCVVYDWSFAYLTLETSGRRSFALSKDVD